MSLAGLVCALSSSNFFSSMSSLIFFYCALVHSDIAVMTLAMHSLMVIFSALAQVVATSAFTSSLSFNRRSYRNRPLRFFLSGSKYDINGLLSEPSYARYWHLAFGNISAHMLLTIARSSLHLTKCTPRCPLQDRGSPECCRSYKSASAMNVRMSVKEPSSLLGPPSFSVLLVRSLKSPVINSGASLESEREMICSHSYRRLGLSVLP